MAKYADGVSAQKDFGIRFQAIVPQQMVRGTGVGDEGASAYARAMGIKPAPSVQYMLHLSRGRRCRERSIDAAQCCLICRRWWVVHFFGGIAVLDIIDVSMACGGQAAFLAGAGVKTIIRYYSRDTGIPQKRLSRSEASAFAAAGLRIGIVHEARHGDRLTSFSEPLGEADAAYAREYATKVIGQPAASAIYFGADVDPNSNQIRDLILPYFKGVAAAFGAANGQSVYQVGVYGSGATCAAVLDAGLATFTWLAQSRGWAGYKAFLQSNRWSLLQAAATKVGEIDCDPNKANGNFGDFFLTQSIAPAAVASGGMQTVNARDGLRLRAGPGTEFDDLQVLPFGTKVHIVKTVGDWALVDLAGDSALDGFVNSHFLSA